MPGCKGTTNHKSQIQSAATSAHHLNDQSRFQERNNTDKWRTESLSYASKLNGAWVRVCALSDNYSVYLLAHLRARFGPRQEIRFGESLG